MTTQRDAKVAELWRQGLRLSEIAERCNLNIHTARNIRERLKLPPRAEARVKLPPPPGFERVARAADSLRDVMAHYKSPRHTVRGWFKTVGVPLPNPAAPPLVVPKDWAERTPTMTIYDGIKYYGMSHNRLKSLVRKTGIRFKPAPSTPKHGVIHKMGRAHSGTYIQPLSTMADVAANVLRHYHANVHRADIRLSDVSKDTWGSIRGLPDKGAGQYFVAGIGVVTEERLIELARRKGANL